MVIANTQAGNHIYLNQFQQGSDLPEEVLAVLVGDLNNDLRVTEKDFEILAANFGREASETEGDINENGIVDFADFLILNANYRRSPLP